MKIIDFSKPIRAITDKSPRQYIGSDGGYFVVADKKHSGTYYRSDEFGRIEQNKSPTYENAPVTHKRIIVLYKAGDHICMGMYVDEADVARCMAYKTILNQKEVEIEEP